MRDLNMKSNKKVQTAKWLVIGILLTMGQGVWAADLQWAGTYRSEGIFIKNNTFDNGQNKEISYLTNHLVLMPKIVAMDGLNIYSRFDLLNNALNNNFSGQVMGNYTGNFASSTGQNYPPAVTTNTQSNSTQNVNQTLSVTLLYMNWVNEFGSLIVGRVPFGFGLGMKYSKGQGPFDHYVTSKDLVAYRMAIGNFTLMPGYGKVRESQLASEDDINDYMILAEYKNPETDLEMGVFYNQRVGPQDSNSPTHGNDMPTSYFVTSSDPSASTPTAFNVYNLNLFVKKKTEYFDFGIEAGFQNGDSGIRMQSGNKVDVAGFGVAAEASYRGGSLTMDLRAGLATGDNPDSSRFEGYFFNGNYNLAMMMFNHPMGQYDALKSTLAGSRPWATSSDTSIQALQGLDTEVVSNAIYFSPRVNWAVGERYDLSATFCYALTQQNPLPAAQGNVGNALGFEMDYGFRYHIGEKFIWETTLGFWFPGSAWTGVPSTNFATNLSYGGTTKAAINF